MNKRNDKSGHQARLPHGFPHNNGGMIQNISNGKEVFYYNNVNSSSFVPMECSIYEYTRFLATKEFPRVESHITTIDPRRLSDDNDVDIFVTRCKTCTLRFDNDLLRASHEKECRSKLKEPNADGRFVCPFCKRTYSTFGNLGTHVNKCPDKDTFPDPNTMIYAKNNML